MRVFISLLCSAACLLAQTLPDAAQLLKDSAAGIKRHKTYQYTTEMKMEMNVAGKPMNLTVTGELSRATPDKLRIESNASMGGRTAIIMDGEFTYVYVAALKQYTKKAALGGLEGMLTSMSMVNMADSAKIEQNAKVVREEAIEVDGKKRDCWVVEMKADRMPLPAPPGAEITDLAITLWIDKEMKMNLQMSMTGKMQAGPMVSDIKQAMTTHSIRLDEPLADSLFTFVPPEGAKEVADFAMPGMKKPDLTGKDAPSFSLKSLDGKTWELSALKGKAIIIDFWATWCAPCRKEMPLLEKLHKEFKDAGLVLLGANVGEDRALVEKFLETVDVTYPIALTNSSDIVPALQVSSFPTYVLIGRDGKIAGYQIGSSGEEPLRDLLGKAGLSAKSN